MSTDVVLAPVPLPNELGVWDATLVTNLNKQRVSHPSMISKTMTHMKHLSSKMYPFEITKDIESSGPCSNVKVWLFFCSALENKRKFKQCRRQRQQQRQKTMI